MQYLRWFFILSLCISPLATAKARFNYTAYTLDNGLQVVILPNPRAPVVYHSLWIKAGTADSPTNKSGLAHFLEHLMFKGTPRFPDNQFAEMMTNLGGISNANTGLDRTLYFVTIAKEHLPLVMDMEADRLENLNFNKDAIEKERGVVLQERRMCVDADAYARLAEAANAAFFWEHPYGQPTIGYEEHIKQYTLEDAKNFYKTWYMPNNAVLVIAGDVQVETLKPLIAKYYGKLKPGILPKRQRLAEIPHLGTTAKIELRDPQIGSFFRRHYSAPNRQNLDIKKLAAINLLCDVLDNPAYGRLTQSLTMNPKLAHRIEVGYTNFTLDNNCLTIAATPINTADVAQLETSVEAELRRLIREGVTETELKTIKEQWTFGERFRHDSLSGLANTFGESLAVGHTLEGLDTYYEVVQNVTPAQVQQVAKEILGMPPLVTSYGQNVSQN